MISSLVTLMLTIYFLIIGINIFELFYFICFVNGVLILRDGIDFLTSKIDTFDPVGLIGLIGYFLFFISPVLQSHWDYWPFIPNLTEEKDWMLFWAITNFFGILIYQYISKFGINKKINNYGYYFNVKKFNIIMPIALLISFGMQMYIYSKFGGISGFIDTFTSRQNEGLVKAGEDPFDGLGLPMLFAESFKILIAIYLIFKLDKIKKHKGNIKFILIMVFFVLIFLLFGGLRGSRSSTVFALFFAAGMYHYWVKKISIKFVFVGILSVSAFLTTYYWYKIAGSEGIRAVFDSNYRNSLNTARQDASKYVIVRDLGRMDVQTLALKRYIGENYEYSYGRTYATAIFSVVPKVILPFKPDQITKEKTEILHGIGSYIKDEPRQTTLVLGQYGEAFINFGVLGIFLYFSILGIIVRKIRQYSAVLQAWDVRRFLLPIFSIIPILMMITDMNVIILNMTRYLFFPFLVFMLCLTKVKFSK